MMPGTRRRANPSACAARRDPAKRRSRACLRSAVRCSPPARSAAPRVRCEPVGPPMDRRSHGRTARPSPGRLIDVDSDVDGRREPGPECCEVAGRGKRRRVVLREEAAVVGVGGGRRRGRRGWRRSRSRCWGRCGRGNRWAGRRRHGRCRRDESNRHARAGRLAGRSFAAGSGPVSLPARRRWRDALREPAAAHSAAPPERRPADAGRRRAPRRPLDGRRRHGE